MPPDGARVGKPGSNYGTRSDLQGGDRQYGDGVNAAKVATSTPGGPRGEKVPAELVKPGQLIPLDAPTMRPDEPTTAGLSSGPGPGPEALNAIPTRGASDDLFELRALYRMFPNEDLRRLIQNAEARL